MGRDIIFDELWALFNVKFNIFIYRITLLLLSLNIDFMGIEEVKDEKGKEEYLKDVLDDKQNKDINFYRQKLIELQYMIAGEHVDFNSASDKVGCGDVEIEKCDPEELKNLLPGGKSVYDLIIERNKGIIYSKEWEKLKCLCGLKRKSGTSKDKESKPEENEKIYEPVPFGKFPILKFMCLMDGKIRKLRECNDISGSDVEEILRYFPGQKWEIFNESCDKGKSDGGLITINSFYDWFSELLETLKEIGNKLENES